MATDEPLGERASYEAEPLWHEFKTARFWILAGGGLVALLIATVIDQDLIIEGATKTTEQRLIDSSVVWFKNIHVWAAILREIGLASLIALILGVLVDRSTRIQQRLSADQALQRITKDVMSAAYGVRTPPRIVVHAISTTFTVPVIRTTADMGFTLRNYSGPNPRSRNNLKLLSVNSSYIIQNFSGIYVDHNIMLTIPFPRFDELRDQVMLVSGSLDDQPLTSSQIERADQSITDSDYERRYRWVRRIEAGKSIRVVLNYQLVKEESDNEVWTCFLPTQDFELSVDVQCSDLLWNVDSRHTGNLHAIDGPAEGPRGAGRVAFRANEPLLPYQGVTLWWRPVELVTMESAQ